MSSTLPVFCVGVTVPVVWAEIWLPKKSKSTQVSVLRPSRQPRISPVEPPGGVEVADEEGEMEGGHQTETSPRGFHSAASRMDQRWMIQPSREPPEHRGEHEHHRRP